MRVCVCVYSDTTTTTVTHRLWLNVGGVESGGVGRSWLSKNRRISISLALSLSLKSPAACAHLLRAPTTTAAKIAKIITYTITRETYTNRVGGSESGIGSGCAREIGIIGAWVVRKENQQINIKTKAANQKKNIYKIKNENRFFFCCLHLHLSFFTFALERRFCFALFLLLLLRF